MAVRIITVDPAHFHAALVHKEVLPGIDPVVHVFAPPGPDLDAHLAHMRGFNARRDNPTRWQVEVHASDDFLQRMLRDPPGDVVVLAGRNNTKIDTILACVEAGLHVLADKPWVIEASQLPKVEQVLEAARRRGVIALDIMTERHEITTILQRELVRDPEVFGELETGSPDRPAVNMESIHAIKKSVAGVPLRRPPAFFDVARNGEGLADVGTHLVDLSFWMIAPDQAIDLHDIRLESAQRWPTLLTRDDYRQITGMSDFPTGVPRDGGRLAYSCNNRVTYAVRGHWVALDIRWDLELPAGDTHNAVFHGSRIAVAVVQPPDRAAPPELVVSPNSPADRAALHAALENRLVAVSDRYPGLGLADHGNGFRITIPNRYRIGHEAHFAQVTADFLRYLRDPAALPPWEYPNLLAKYHVTTRGVEMARTGMSAP